MNLRHLSLALTFVFSIGSSWAVTLPKGVATEATIERAKELKAHFSTARGYTAEQNPEENTYQCVHFISSKYAIALIPSSREITRIKYEGDTKEVVVRNVEPVWGTRDTLKHDPVVYELDYKLVVYELDSPIEGVRSYKLPNTEHMCKEFYLFTYSPTSSDTENHLLKAAFTDKAQLILGKGMIVIPDEEEGDSGFLTDSCDIGSALVSPEGEGFILCGLPISSNEDALESYFIPFSKYLVDEILKGIWRYENRSRNSIPRGGKEIKCGDPWCSGLEPCQKCLLPHYNPPKCSSC